MAFAARKHSGQKRKGKDEEPYINHPLEVANLLVTVGGVEDIDVLAAGLLHEPDHALDGAPLPTQAMTILTTRDEGAQPARQDRGGDALK